MLKLAVRLLVSSTLLFGFLVAMSPVLAQAPPGGPPPGGPGGPGPRPSGFPPAPPDSMASSRDSLMNVVLKSIAGRENVAAESVFKNIKVLKGMPAGRMLRVMNVAFGRSLGAGCEHCHDTKAWDKDDKRPKQVARDMWTMLPTINDSLLAKIPNLESKQAFVNCTTCHRGQRLPNGPERPAPPRGGGGGGGSR
jgi:hypothetical protein